MSDKTVATRRSFIAIAGASLSAPAAAAAALPWLPPSGAGGAALAVRLASLEDLNAICAIQVTVVSQTPIEPQCTVVEMATLQGGGVITRGGPSGGRPMA